MESEFDGPIPGENFTSDTRNYPWHRPPDKTDFVDIVDTAINKIYNDPEATSQTLAFLETGMTILDHVTGMLRLGVSDGRIPIDMAILASGPIAKAIDVLAESAGIEYEKGFDPAPRILTGERIRALQGREPIEEDVERGPTPADDLEGLMAPNSGPAPADEQASMLGHSAEGEF